MSRDETMILITKVRSYYPSWMPKVQPKELIDNWFDVLRKYEYKAVLDMLEKYIAEDESGFAPSISRLCPKQYRNGYRERIYSHADFIEMEKAALEELGFSKEVTPCT